MRSALAMRILIFGFIFLLMHSASFGHELACRDLLDGSGLQKTINSLAELRFQLDGALTENQDSIAISLMHLKYKNKEKEFFDIVERDGLLTREQARELIKKEVALLNVRDKINRVEEIKKREATKFAPLVDGKVPQFHTVQPKTFNMVGRKSIQGILQKYPVSTTLSRPVHMMATLTTQHMWRRVVEIGKKYGVSETLLKESPSKNSGSDKDLHPVENISYDDIRNWFHLLNWLSRENKPEIYSFIPSHKKGDTYRLPTNAEWEYIAQVAGTFYDSYYFGDKSNVEEFEWSAHFQKTTHPVAMLRPLLIGTSDFYDMFANVSEIVSDWYGDVEGGVDPIGPTDPNDIYVGYTHIVRGFYRGAMDFNGGGDYSSQRRDAKVDWVGFRIVRVR